MVTTHLIHSMQCFQRLPSTGVTGGWQRCCVGNCWLALRRSTQSVPLQERVLLPLQEISAPALELHRTRALPLLRLCSFHSMTTSCTRSGCPLQSFHSLKLHVCAHRHTCGSQSV